jgi:hypothetical protein
MSIATKLQQILDAKASIKAAIEEKGVTVGNAPLAQYATKIGEIETGGSVPTILNPVNGGIVGGSSTSGVVTHQYRISSGTITGGFLAISPSDDRWVAYDSGGYATHNAPYNSIGVAYSTMIQGCYLTVSISSSGLLSVNYNRSSSEVSEYGWEDPDECVVCLMADSGVILSDTIKVYTGYSCFIKDTLIHLSNGSTKFVQDISYDDNLLVWNFDEGKYDSAKPIWIKRTQTTNWYYRLTFSDGSTLCVTGTYPEAHSLYSYDDGKFIHANNLVGKRVYTMNGIQTLVSCEEKHEDVEFYNVITDYHMNLFANGVLASTSLNNLYPIKDMRFVKEGKSVEKSKYALPRKFITGLRLEEQENDVGRYCMNLLLSMKLKE